MAKGFLASAKSYMKNLSKRAGRVATGAESPKTALGGFTRDTAKLKRSLGKSKTTKDTRRATDMTRKGQRAYNEKDYAEAEECFRHALTYDAEYLPAQLYLGHALYQLGRLEDALRAWERVIECDAASKEAIRAQRKIHHVEKSRADVIEHLRTRLKE